MTLDEARADWIATRPEYCAFADLLKSRLEEVAKTLGVFAEVTARAKETPSLVKKLLLKSHLTYETLPDKVGARVIVRYRSDLETFEAKLKQNFSYEAVDDKSVKLGADKVGYQSIHIDSFALHASDEECKRFPIERFFGELQLRTLSQHLWSEVSHDTFYKNDHLVNQLPPDLQRRVNLTAGLIEVADREFDRMNAEAQPNPTVEVFSGLEKLYYSLGTRRPNVELSLEVIGLIMPLYGSCTPNEIMSEFVVPAFEKNRASLAELYSDPQLYGAADSVFLFQPEAFLLFERLQYDRDQLLTKWNERFPEKELNSFAAALGFSLE